ncbi:sigma 54-interacting transcriptional regulator [Lewinella sp. IMCC34183]|uniref:sigma 54-interacting transcriptional regulator n=1 Tax=Lewinella sp. IMCC34183 TaxID=2248762 RepID=UPI0018E53ED3|nr:sigma 54-interacting transcriptional regulator [Lewinella sp. IMCC34183]
MTDSEPPPLTLPPSIAEWVRANPLPTQLLTGDGGVLITNAAFSTLLNQLGRGPDDLLTDLLPTGWELPVSQKGWFATLRSGECLVKKLRLRGDQRYTFHLVKLTLPGGVCLCCMLMPGDDLSEARLVGILNSIACYVMEIDTRGNLSYLNDPLRERLGYALGDLKRLGHVRQLWDRFRTDELLRLLAEVDNHGQVQFRGGLTRKDGKVMPMEISIVASQLPNESLYLVTARDVAAKFSHEVSLNTALVEVGEYARTVENENHDLRAKLNYRVEETHLVYRSAAFGAVVRRIQHVAPGDDCVLITGEPGTGKQLIGRAIHELSRRADQPLITVDCAALPPALLERELFTYQPDTFAKAANLRPAYYQAAAGGTLLLREIGALPLPMQARLLEMMEGETTPPVRLLATTNLDLQRLAERGSFRAELLDRLNVYPVACIPLRERRADIYPLVRHFIDTFNQQYGNGISGIDATSLRHLQAYHFPGNIRELEQIVERAYILAAGGLPPQPQPTKASRHPGKPPELNLFDGMLTEFVAFEEYQRKYLQRVLDSAAGKVSGEGGAAEILGMHPQTLFSKLRKLGIRR